MSGVTIQEIVERFDDLVAALERIAQVLEDVSSDGRLHTNDLPR